MKKYIEPELELFAVLDVIVMSGGDPYTEDQFNPETKPTF